MVSMKFSSLAVLASLAGQAMAAPTPAEIQDRSTVAGVSTISSVNGKRGIAYNEARFAQPLQSACSKCAWAYSWESDNKGFSSLPFIPSLHDGSALFTSTFVANAWGYAINSGTLFSINEPDQPSQANMDVWSAVNLHTQYMKGWNGVFEIVSPAVSSENTSGRGLDYLAQWVSACNQTANCRFDTCNVHWYGPVGADGDFISFVSRAHDVCLGRPIWVTEFGLYDGAASSAQAAAFIRNVVPQLDSLSYVKGYSYFMAAAGTQRLNNDDGSLNEVGRAYATV